MQASAVEGNWRLPGRAIVHLQGPDGVSFLHGQLTNAVQDLPPDQARPAGYCSAQGRLLANGVFWSSGAHGIDFMVSRDLAEALVRRLRMFVLRAKVTITLDAARDIQGVCGASHVPQALHGLPAWSRRDLQGATWIVAPMADHTAPAAWRVEMQAAGAARAASDANHPAAPPDAVGTSMAEATRTATVGATDPAAGWAALRLAHGWPWITAGTQDLFLASTLDMDLNGSIDFAKGCYPGQEVIARSHYRGTVKRRMACGTAPWPAGSPPLPPAADLHAAGEAGGRPVGRVIESVVHEGLLYVAAEITLSDWPAMRHAVGAADGPQLRLQTPRAART